MKVVTSNNITIPINSDGCVAISNGSFFNQAHLDKSYLKQFSDQDIEQEYIRRFSPLAKALKENEDE